MGKWDREVSPFNEVNAPSCDVFLRSDAQKRSFFFQPSDTDLTIQLACDDRSMCVCVCVTIQQFPGLTNSATIWQLSNCDTRIFILSYRSRVKFGVIFLQRNEMIYRADFNLLTASHANHA